MQYVLPLYDPRKGLFPRSNHDPRHTFLIKLLINHQELIKTGFGVLKFANLSYQFKQVV